MPPRKSLPKSRAETKSLKGKIYTKQSTKAKSSLKTKPAPKRVGKRPAPDSELEEPKPWDIGITSKYARERKRFRLSRASLDEHIDEAYIANLASTLHGRSLETWGVGSSAPIEGVRQKKSPKPLFFRGEGAQKYFELMEEMSPKPTKVGTNNPDTVPLLRTSLEIRERIYSYLFLFDKPIIVKYSWKEAERNLYEANTFSLTLSCVLFSIEVPEFIFRNNTIQALLRIPKGQYIRSEEHHMIPKLQLGNLRNITLNCSKDCWNIDWYEKASDGLAKLAEFNPSIQSFTLIVIPQQVTKSTTALGIEDYPITFADFLWEKGAFMIAVRKLAPKQFKIVIKKNLTNNFEISVDMTSFRQKVMDVGPLANIFTAWKLNRRSWMVEQELRGLKERFEEVFNDDERSVAKGSCKPLPSRLKTSPVILSDNTEGLFANNNSESQEPQGSSGADERILWWSKDEVIIKIEPED